MIFDQFWIKKHGVIINITINFLAFWPGYYIYIRAISPISLSSLLTEIVAIKIKKDITP